jgi:hypothetical protein
VYAFSLPRKSTSKGVPKEASSVIIHRSNAAIIECLKERKVTADLAEVWDSSLRNV